MIRLLFDTTIGGLRHGKGSIIDLGKVLELQLINEGDAETVASMDSAHPYYHFHGFAGDQIDGDSMFYDKAASNHAVRGANLSNAQLWATAGYASTVDSTGPAPDPVLRIPAIDFDYAGGEKLIIWWLGKCTPEAGYEAFTGDGYSSGQRGWSIRVTPTGKVQPMLYGVTTGFGGVSAATAFDGTLRDLGVVLDGQNKKYCVWVDGAVDTNFGSDYIVFDNGSAFDTKSTNTVNLGSSTPAPGGTLGIATATRAYVILRLPASYSVPAIADVTAAFRQLRANPGKLLLASAF